mmetsp:Transcript_27692/g.54356  ORF Transcript_27692/g.54356 Transcript_27692/m.54356 type:complete len:292 (+) Transcript_27692:44-919(+)|eukprot:CAMPEP_0172719128 /NCGR_PEP_ID=MMETSP1074-20121228/75326_1 /TAXON_ID=2916 /ORGANISM="Ceratium fusus, Strain PA161109" /LENGTH=291 /DNA_ID=CAMNT_0013544449 /DNA_START=44 /DNA_END=919 /DNA_ORIENTATION=-
MTFCQSYDYSVDLQASRRALESSIVAWLKRESTNTNPDCVDMNHVDFEIEISNDETTVSNDDNVGLGETAMEQLCWKASSENCDSSFTQQTCVVLDPTRRHSIAPTEMSMIHKQNNRAFATSQPLPSLAPRWTAELSATSIKLGVKLNRSNAATSVKWIVDAKKMRSTDRVVVSSLFLVLLSGQPMPFRMMLVPAAVCRRRGGHCFKRARGRGSVQLKCETNHFQEDVNTKITFTLCVGPGPLRGPHEHDLRHAMLCGLPRDQAHWNFDEAEDVLSHTFTVCLTVLHDGTL